MTKAAERLHTSQPAVSAHIKALESELGVTLFLRTPKGMVLTREGAELKERAATILEGIDDLRTAADKLKGGVHGDTNSILKSANNNSVIIQNIVLYPV